MGILDFEAYWLERWTETSEGYYDDNGDYHPGDGQWEPVGRVNAAPPSGPNTITLPDGHTDTFSFVIHIHDPRCQGFRHGDRVRLTNPYGEQYELTVKGAMRHQLKYVIHA